MKNPEGNATAAPFLAFSEGSAPTPATPADGTGWPTMGTWRDGVADYIMMDVPWGWVAVTLFIAAMALLVWRKYPTIGGWFTPGRRDTLTAPRIEPDTAVTRPTKLADTNRLFWTGTTAITPAVTPPPAPSTVVAPAPPVTVHAATEAITAYSNTPDRRRWPATETATGRNLPVLYILARAAPGTPDAGRFIVVRPDIYLVYFNGAYVWPSEVASTR